MQKEAYKVGIAEDHPLFREGLKDFIEKRVGDKVVFDVGSADEILDSIKKHNPNLLVMDLSMPGIPVFTVIELIRKRFSQDVKILILSLYDDEATISSCFKLGVDGYLCKKADPSEIQNAIEQIKKHGYFVCVEATKYYVKNLQTGKPTSTIDFSDKELDLIRHIVDEVKTAEIAELLKTSVKSIEVYKRKIMTKIGCKTSIGIVRYAIEHGLV